MIRLKCLNDTIMTKNQQKQQKIIKILLKEANLSSSDILNRWLKLYQEEVSLVTIKRYLSQLVEDKFLETDGSGRSVNYFLSTTGRVLADIDARQYCAVEPDKRHGYKSYNFSLWQNFPEEIFSDQELVDLNQATAKYLQRKIDLSSVLKRKELERLIIELSWKSSKIEGNTYTLLDTEKLVLENKAAVGKSSDEAQMILNHKAAFEFVLSHRAEFKKPNLAVLEELHKILILKLGVTPNLRHSPVGVTGSVYRPLDNNHQINEAVEDLLLAVSRVKSPYAKALTLKAGLAYIQAFEDGNKRTGRLAANAVLLAYNLAPLSYRSVDEVEYKDATLVFYELNSIMPLKEIFISQYKFAADNYAV